jgi:hypothetical protein
MEAAMMPAVLAGDRVDEAVSETEVGAGTSGVDVIDGRPGDDEEAVEDLEARSGRDKERLFVVVLLAVDCDGWCG